MNAESFFTFSAPRKREHPIELDIDQLETERAKRRYVSEFLSSELTALSLHGSDKEERQVNVMELDGGNSNKSAQSLARRKHVVMVTNLDAEAADAEISEEEANEKKLSLFMPGEIRKSLKKIPQELLLPRTENPVRALVLYQRPPWLPLETSDQDKDANHERRVSDIMENSKLSPIPENPSSPVIEVEEMELDADVENGNRNSYDGYLGDDDEDGLDDMEL
ncbi:16401_t:CDS:2 [Acaulospora colombiana]|uniref:16401_t:CDS:1 n=1 Tax=Acaulospora colombiana TaxID=27376 RepID=A0ACA9KU90_9GLOM|nr:16401_t:CDS:2 [Acaulospora colombiana]